MKTLCNILFHHNEYAYEKSFTETAFNFELESLSLSCCLIEPKLFVESCASDRKTNASMPVMQNRINGVLSLLDSNTRNWPNKGPQIYVLIDEVEIPDSPCSVLFMCVYVCVSVFVC